MARITAVLIALFMLAAPAAAQPQPPELTQPVNDFANVIDPQSKAAMDMVIRSLQQASGDVIVVATVPTFKPYGDIREYAVKMFENHGRGIGERGKDNGLLILLAVNDRQVWIEVGYDLEQFVTDGFSGETSRQFMAPQFRGGNYGAGLLAGVTRVAGRVAQGRNVTLQGVRQEQPRDDSPDVGSGSNIVLLIFIVFIVINAIARTRRGRRFGGWGMGGWSGWNSGIGPFGGGFGGGGGGGFGGGFGGFGGGSSGGGGGGASW